MKMKNQEIRYMKILMKVATLVDLESLPTSAVSPQHTSHAVTRCHQQRSQIPLLHQIVMSNMLLTTESRLFNG